MSDSYYDPPETPEPEGSVTITVDLPAEEWPYPLPEGAVEVSAEVDVDLPDADATVRQWTAYSETGAVLAEAKKCKGMSLVLEEAEVERAVEVAMDAARFEDDDAYDRARERDW